MGIKVPKASNSNRGMPTIAKIKGIGNMILIAMIKAMQPDHTREETTQVSISFKQF